MEKLTAPHIITAADAILDAWIGALVSVVVVYINRRFDDRRHTREVAITAIHMLLLADLLAKKRIIEKNVVAKLSRIRGVSDIAAEAIKPKPDGQHKP